MKRRIWALITGAIRSDFYFRVILIKLCDMRAKGIIEEIVFSTWLGELDKFEDLREILKKLDIILVEKPYIDEKIGKYTEIAFERQRTQIFNALRIIPPGVYVIKLRTDYILGISKLFRAIKNNTNLEVNSFGSFPLIYNQKILMQIYNFRQLLFANDRFFFASREDMNKLTLPVMYHMTRKFNVAAENKLLFGYAYHFYPLLRDAGDLIPIEFYNLLHDYCNRQPEESLVIPRLIHRLYALTCVFIYTQIKLIDNNSDESDEPINISDLYRDKIKTNNQIRKIVLGNTKDSLLSNVFNTELRDIALNSPKTHGYTYQEYMELRLFVTEKLGKKSLIGEYQFYDKSFDKEIRKVEKETASSLLFKKYHDDKHTKKIANLIDENFDSPSISLYKQMKPHENLNENLRLELYRVGIFDLNIEAIFDYGEKLLLNRELFNMAAWNQAIKYINTHISVGDLNLRQILICYDYLKNYRVLLSSYPAISKTRVTLYKSVGRVVGKMGIHKSEFDSEEEFTDIIIKKLYTNIDGEEEEYFPLIKALDHIYQNINPFSKEIFSKIYKHGQGVYANELEEKYKGKVFRISDWLVTDKLTMLLQKNDVESLLQYVKVVEGKREAEVVSRHMLSVLWDLPQKTQERVVSAIDSLGKRLSLDIFPVKLARLIRSNRLELNEDDMSMDNNFTLLLETLYRHKALKQNMNVVQKYCYGVERLVQLYAFVELEVKPQLKFFSMKNTHEIWLHYVPYLEHEGSKALEVPVWKNGQTWPGADRKNESAFAAYIRLLGSDVFISIEMSAKDTVRARKLAQSVGYEEKNSPGNLIRFVTKRFPFKDENDLSRAVNEALDEFCKVGEKVVAALDGFQHEKAPAM